MERRGRQQPASPEIAMIAILPTPPTVASTEQARGEPRMEGQMQINRRDFLLGASATGLAAMDGTPAGAAPLPLKQAAAYFGPIVEDNGIQFRSTNFANITIKWPRRSVPI